MNIPILITVLAVYFIIMLVIGLIGTKKFKGDFNKMINADKSTTVLMFIGAAVGAHIGNGFVVGGAADGAANGISGAWYGIVCALSYVFVLLFFNKRIYQKGFITLADFLKDRYHSNISSGLFIISTVVGLTGQIGVQLMAGKAMFESLGLNGTWGVIILTAIVLAYTLLSGLWGAFMTSAIQIGVITAGLIITTVVLLFNGATGVIGNAFAAGQLPKTYFELLPGGISPVLLMLIPITMAVIADQCTVQRINSCKSEAVAKKGWLYSILLMLPLAIMPAFIGMYAAAKYGVADNTAFFTVAIQALPSVLGAVMMAAVLSAIMSTIDAFMVGISTMVLHDVYQGMINPKADPKKLNVWDKIVGAVVAVIGLFIALKATNIVGMLCELTAFVAAGCFVPFVGGLFWKKGTAKGASAASIAGMIAMIVHWSGLVKLPMDSVGASVISLIVYVIVSLATQKDKEMAKE